MYARIDAVVMPHGKECFDRLPVDVSHLDRRWQECFNHATYSMPIDELLSPWPKAFASDDPAEGGCPAFELP